MPFKSEKQRKYMWAKHPDIAKRWEDEGKGYVERKKHEKKKSKEKRNARRGGKRS